MKPSKGVLVGIAACWGALALSGCGPAAVDDLPRQAVSGTVTFDGTPLAQGTIAFTPDTGAPTPAMVSINGGGYSIPRAHGLVAGSYHVSILGSATTEPAEKFGDMPGKAHREQAEAADRRQRAESLGKASTPNQLVPSRYNTATELIADVKDGAANTFNFDLTSSATPKK